MIKVASQNDINILVRLYKDTINNNLFVKRYIKSNIILSNIYINIYDDKIIGMYIREDRRYLNPYITKPSTKMYTWLDQICVQPSKQVRGIGTELMYHLILSTKHDIRLLCDISLVSYYRKFKFESVEDVFHNGREQHIMERKYIN